MVGCFFKANVFVGILLSVWDIATDIMAVYDFHQVLGDYTENAEKMIEGISGVGASNFKANSTFFFMLAEEYDGLSDFDKDYVYCDIYSIQADPDSLLKESWNIFWASFGVIIVSLIPIAIGYYGLCRIIRTGEIYNGKGESGLREKLWNFLTKTAIQFAEDGPQLAILWLIIMRYSRLDGYMCQEKFYQCGVSGDCTMANLMVPVPLNSSIVDFVTTDIFLALSFCTSLGMVLFNFGSGVYLWLSAGAPRLVLFPFMQLSLSVLPLFWMIYIDGMIFIGRTASMEGAIVIGICIFMSLCLCCSLVLMVVIGHKNAWKVETDKVTHLRVRSSTLGL